MTLSAANWNDLLANSPPGQRKRAEWIARARPKQVTPKGDWFAWLLLTGRGWGKTDTGAQDMAEYGRTHDGAQMAIVGRTDREARRVCVEGPTGLLAALDRSEVATYNRSPGDMYVRLTNGATFYVASADVPDSLLGLNLDRAWCDELAAWRRPETWDRALLPALRRGADPRVIVTTTPRPTPLVQQLLDSPTTFVTRGTTQENEANLPVGFIDEMRRRLPHRLFRQEVYGELLTDVPGALWTMAQIEADRRWPLADGRLLPGQEWFRDVVVGVDPSDANGEGDEFGIAVAALATDHELYVVDSLGVQDGPVESLRRAVTLARQYGGRLVLEKNHGGAYLIATLEQVLREEGVRIPYEVVSASDGKRARAEPVAALYEQHRVHHLGVFPELEDQLTTFTGGGKSPDRLDALVWALTPFLGYTLAPDRGGPPVARWGAGNSDAVPWGGLDDDVTPLAGGFSYAGL
jgi:predicted phage terminase large subunit-like protein